MTAPRTAQEWADSYGDGDPMADEQDAEDFDAWWASQARQAPSLVVKGRRVEVQDLPLDFMARVRALETSQDDNAFADLLAELWGEDVLDDWTARGMTAAQLKILFAWAVANGSGQTLTLDEAAAKVAEAEQQNPPNRAARRAAARPGARPAARSPRRSSPAGR